MNKNVKRAVIFCALLLVTAGVANEFVIKKEKRKTISMSKLKEQYAHECGDCIKKIPDVQKYAAKIQKILIDDINALCYDTVASAIGTLAKEQLEVRAIKIVHLAKELEKFDTQLRSLYNDLK